MTDFNIRPLQRHEAGSLGATMARAFFEDPMAEFLESDESRRLKKYNWFMSSGIAYCARYGAVYTEDNYRGGAVWMTPGNTDMSLVRALRSGMWLMPFRMGFGTSRRFSQIARVTEPAHKRIVPGDHWYLMILGVDPDSQGTGLGSALLDTGVSKAAEAGVPVYLETMTDADVEFYTKRGFEVVEELEVSPELKMWGMIKQPG